MGDDYDRMVRERNQLLHRKYSGSGEPFLRPEEQARLDQLSEVLQELDMELMREPLRKMEELVESHERLAKQVSRTLQLVRGAK